MGGSGKQRGRVFAVVEASIVNHARNIHHSANQNYLEEWHMRWRGTKVHQTKTETRVRQQQQV